MLRSALDSFGCPRGLIGRLVLALRILLPAVSTARAWRPAPRAGDAAAPCRVDRHAWGEIRARYRLKHLLVPA